ncbi:MAG: ribosome silencing factor [Actinobacteria bacterium]|nr:ribosome silencing factor [Actinomycetota bacterium]
MPEDDQTSSAEEPQESLDNDAMTQPAEESLASDMGVPQRDEPRRRSTNDEVELIHRHAFLAAATASGMKAEEIRILDVHELVPYTDFLVICNGRSVRQTRRIAEEIGFKLKSELERVPKQVEGQASGEWVLMDYLDFIVHVFTPEAREFYRLDVLWKEAPREVLE